MSGPAKRRGVRQSIQGQWAPRTIAMLESEAHCALSLSARRVLDRLEIELAHHGGNDNGSLPVTFADFERFGIDRHAIAPAIREVVALGFVEVTRQGRAGNAEYRLPSWYRLTYRNLNRSGPTDEWKRFTSAKEAKDAAKAARGVAEPKKQKTASKDHPFLKSL